MLEAALLGRARVPSDGDGFALDRRTGIVGQGESVTPHDGDLALLQDDLAPRVRQNCGGVGGNVHLALADADHQRARTVARKD